MIFYSLFHYLYVKAHWAEAVVAADHGGVRVLHPAVIEVATASG